MINRITFFAALMLLLASHPLFADDATKREDELVRFVKGNCADCHTGASAEAGFDVSRISGKLEDANTFRDWVKVYDRVAAGEMPPKDARELKPEERDGFLKDSKGWLIGYQQTQFDLYGRVHGKRLTNLQLERTLQDLLAIDIPLAYQMPKDMRAHNFSTVVEAQQMSHFQMQQHIHVVDLALDEAFEQAVSTEEPEVRELSAEKMERKRNHCREPEVIDGDIVVWPSRLEFYGRNPATTVKEDGWYRVTLHGVHALRSPEKHGVWCTIRSGRGSSNAPLLYWIGAFEATDEKKDVTVTAWIKAQDMLEIRPYDATLKTIPSPGGHVYTGDGMKTEGAPGMAIHSITMERLMPDREAIRKVLFGDLEVKLPKKKNEAAELVSDAVEVDTRKLVESFCQKALRRPIDTNMVDRYHELLMEEYKKGLPLMDAVRLAYRAVLCSPRFLYFDEEAGPLDDYALASRLSYFLWNSMPDAELMGLAEKGKLRQKEVLHQQVERMLEHPRGAEFIKHFAAEWLELSEIDFTDPDRRMFPTFDVIVQNGMLDETHAFLEYLLDENLSVANLIDSDVTFVNSRLARYYGIDDVEGDALRKVELKPIHHRGGLLTNGSILKVTANGTNTSPVLRGVWLCDRILGVEVPPPPQNVPAIEPDIRGATTIRELLEKHKSDENCASCHKKIDPPGFALESYDPSGQFRRTYGNAARRKKNDPVVDVSGQLPDGREFDDVDEFQELLLKDVSPIAKNLAAKLITYSTGSPISFADRSRLDELVNEVRDDDFGFRSIVHATVESPLFLNK